MAVWKENEGLKVWDLSLEFKYSTKYPRGKIQMHLHTEEPLFCPPPFSLHPPGGEVFMLATYKTLVK